MHRPYGLYMRLRVQVVAATVMCFFTGGREKSEKTEETQGETR
jgi:hypothetical protein